jgi:hypothetical protein
MKKVLSALAFIILFSTAASSQGGILSQKIVFTHPYKFKNNAFSKKLMSGTILEDSASNERLIILSGNKTLNFYLVDNNWKLLKTFESPTPKNSAFNNDNFDIVNYSRGPDRWIIITGNYTEFNAETVDTKEGKHAVAGAVFQDKDKNYFGKTIYDGKRTFNMYPNRSGNITVAVVDENSTIKNYPVDLSSQLPLKKDKKLAARDIYHMFDEIDTLTSQQLYMVRRKVHFYNTPSSFLFTVSHEEPVTEVIYFDRGNWKKQKSELFSVEELLPANARGNTLNTSSLIHDNKLFVYSAYKEGGVLGVFDINSKKLVYSLKIDNATPKSSFAYGPVMYKASPSSGKIFSGEYNVKDKVEDIGMDDYNKELSKRDIGIYVHHYNANEYAVSIGSFSMLTIQNPGSANRVMSTTSDPSVYESAVLGLVFKRGEAAPIARKTDYNEVHYRNMESNAAPKTEKKVMQQPEFSDNRKAFIMKEQVIKNKVYTLYYLDENFKIFEKVTSFDLSKFGLK